MKTTASIFLILAILFTAQPLLSNQLLMTAVSSCSKMECCGAGRKADEIGKTGEVGNTGGTQKTREQRKTDANKCGNEGCCMCISIVSSNFYLVGKCDYSFPAITTQKKKKSTTDDDRLSKGLSESWHPPEYVLRVC